MAYTRLDRNKTGNAIFFSPLSQLLNAFISFFYPGRLKHRLPHFSNSQNSQAVKTPPSTPPLRIDFLKNVFRRSEALHPGTLPFLIPCFYLPHSNLHIHVYYQCPLFISFLLSLSISHTHLSFCFPYPPTNNAASISTCAGFFPHWTCTRVTFFAAMEISILFCCFDHFDCICGPGIIHLQALITSIIVSSI